MRGKPFQPGNTFGRGRPPGSRNKVASALQQTLEEHAETLTKKCAHLALQGNTTAMRLCMERLLPARRQRVLEFKLPAIKTMANLASASETVVRGVTRGLLTPGEGQAFTVMLDGRRRMIETQELEVRLRALEESRNKP
jgi:Family of unknown function (DUF5681)